MKHNDFDVDVKIDKTNLANLFHVYDDESLGNLALRYNVNRTFVVDGIENASKEVYQEYTVMSPDTWTNISFKFYQTTRLWWLICKMNGIVDPTAEISSGTKLKIMKEKYVKIVLDNIRIG
jgi:nucleoid-associated protein YgaU